MHTENGKPSQNDYCFISYMEVRERIITECSKMMMSVGITSMTMDNVAHACGISKRTLYEVFPDKRSSLSASSTTMRSRTPR